MEGGEDLKLTLKEWRRAKGCSITKLANSLDVSFSTIMRWEENAEKMPIGKVVDACEVLGIRLDDILF